ncbi:MAG: carbamoyltransferase HypF [Anaerolineae bacterium]|nr:carbamoyltransferase HypF [Anaerolineae bacterium]
MTQHQFTRRAIHVDGVVQGVGFRPFVYGLATRLGLSGWVRNTSAGVDIEVQGAAGALDAFTQALRAQAPPLAVIEGIQEREVAPEPANGFVILHSAPAAGVSLVAPDVAVCADCRRELFDPRDRRYRYPFINCTNCGPRFTIMRGLPYDRPQTTMQPFPMCPVCQAEYDDPANRRFHAQPNACPVCGPHVWLMRGDGTRLAVRDDAMRQAADLLRQGEIVAVKGLGGFHLACDATNAEAVARMRARKRRPAKPFAVMVADAAEAARHCALGDAEAALLAAPAAPILLLPWRDGSPIARAVAPGNRYLGVMLPYTPLHHILLHDVGRPLVMTSGNHIDEPLSFRNEDVVAELGDIADAFLLHDREVYMRCDDSVTMVVEGAPYPVRRSRGYAPYPIALSHLAAPSPREVLAVGGQMKNTLCFLKGARAFLSQHVGELDNLETLAYFEQVADHLRDVFRAQPAALAYDAHPDYLASRWARGEISVATPVAALLPGVARRVPVQHHHAHIAACLADNDHPGPVIGLAWDGTGYGPDGAIWGGEALLADRAQYTRFAHLEYAPLPGGEAAIMRPARLAVAYAQHFLGAVPDLPGLARVGAVERQAVAQQVARGYNTAWTSSMGRLFDVAAAMLGLCPDGVTFEAQAAIALEMLALAHDDGARAGRVRAPVSDLPHPLPLSHEGRGKPESPYPFMGEGFRREGIHGSSRLPRRWRSSRATCWRARLGPRSPCAFTPGWRRPRATWRNWRGRTMVTMRWRCRAGSGRIGCCSA